MPYIKSVMRKSVFNQLHLTWLFIFQYNGFSIFFVCAVSVSCSKTFRVVLNCKDREAKYLGEVVTVLYWVVGVESDSARYRSVTGINPASKTLWTALIFFRCRFFFRC